jgi:hypothetical protein
VLSTLADILLVPGSKSIFAEERALTHLQAEAISILVEVDQSAAFAVSRQYAVDVGLERLL